MFLTALFKNDRTFTKSVCLHVFGWEPTELHSCKVTYHFCGGGCGRTNRDTRVDDVVWSETREQAKSKQRAALGRSDLIRHPSQCSFPPDTRKEIIQPVETAGSYLSEPGNRQHITPPKTAIFHFYTAGRIK